MQKKKEPNKIAQFALTQTLHPQLPTRYFFFCYKHFPGNNFTMLFCVVRHIRMNIILNQKDVACHTYELLKNIRYFNFIVKKQT